MNPERIYNWRDSQLSIARHYGGITFNGSSYLIAYGEDGQPLVRADVIKRERKAAKKAASPVEQCQIDMEDR